MTMPEISRVPTATFIFVILFGFIIPLTAMFYYYYIDGTLSAEEKTVKEYTNNNLIDDKIVILIYIIIFRLILATLYYFSSNKLALILDGKGRKNIYSYTHSLIIGILVPVVGLGVLFNQKNDPKNTDKINTRENIIKDRQSLATFIVTLFVSVIFIIYPR